MKTPLSLLWVLLPSLSLLAAPTTAPTTRPLRVALYTATGAEGEGPRKIEAALLARGEKVWHVDTDDIRRGVLNAADVLVQPGGSGSAQGNALGTDGREKIRAFIYGGGGYVGICSGCYLATCKYNWSLDLINAKAVDTAHWARGRANLKVEFTPLGKQILGDPPTSPDGTVSILYHNGPVLAVADRDDLGAFEPLAYFRTEITAKGAKEGLMVNSPAMVAGQYGQGRVISISPHPEQTAGLEDVIPRAARWVAGREEP